MPKVIELYARAYATEGEHFIIEDDIRQRCLMWSLELVYYRQLKTGHIPLWREFKIKGDSSYVLQFAKMFEHVIDNSWRK